MSDASKKGYWIAHVQVNEGDDVATQYKRYVDGAAPAFKEYGAEFLARGGDFVQFEGDDLGARHVVIAFKDLASAKACYESETYQTARAHRLPVSSAKILIVEGV